MELKEEMFKDVKREDLEQEPVFSNDMYELFKSSGLTAEEIETLENAQLIADVANTLPDNPDKVVENLKNMPTTDKNKAMDYLGNLAQKNPKDFIDIMAMTEVVSHVSDK